MNEKLVKIVFQDETAKDKQLNIIVEATRDEKGKITSLEVIMAPTDVDAFTYNPFVIRMYYDVLNTIVKAKMEYDNNGKYPDLHILTTAEYKEYVTKVLGIKIPEDDNSKNMADKKYTKEDMLFAFVHGGTKFEENKDANILDKNFKELINSLNKQDNENKPK